MYKFDETFKWIESQRQYDRVIVYYHGTGHCADKKYAMLKQLAQTFQYDLIIPEYKGFAEVEQIQKWEDFFTYQKEFFQKHVEATYKTENTIIVGHSLGTSVATFLSQFYSFQKIILISPFSSIHDLIEYHLPLSSLYLWQWPRHLYNSVEHMNHARFNTYEIYHGLNDHLVPWTHSWILNQISNQGKIQTHLNILPFHGHKKMPIYQCIQLSLMKGNNKKITKKRLVGEFRSSGFDIP